MVLAKNPQFFKVINSPLLFNVCKNDVYWIENFNESILTAIGHKNITILKDPANCEILKHDNDLLYECTFNENAVKLVDHISNDRDDDYWEGLSSNKAAIHLLEKNPEKIEWRWLSSNTAAIHLLEKNPEKIKWDWLSLNAEAIHILKKNPKKIEWNWLSENPSAIPILKENYNRINWKHLSRNPAAIHMLKENPDMIDWESLSENILANEILRKSPKKIIWNSMFRYGTVFSI